MDKLHNYQFNALNLKMKHLFMRLCRVRSKFNGDEIQNINENYSANP